MTRQRYRSLKSIKWACEQRSGHAPANHLLIQMAYEVSDKLMTSKAGNEWPPHHCWASIDTLVEVTDQNRKTIESNLKRLIAANLIERVGNDGKTGRCAVYRLRVNDPKTGVVGRQAITPVFPANHPKFGQPPIDNEKKETERRERTPSAFASQSKANSRHEQPQELTLAEWRERIKANGEAPVQANDPIFDYANEVGIAPAMIPVQWHQFVQTYTEDRPTKTYTDWRAVFRTSVRGNWFRLWSMDAAGAKWTSNGLQAQASYRALIARRFRQEQEQATHDAPTSPARGGGQQAAQEARPGDPADPEATQAPTGPGKGPTGPQIGSPGQAADHGSALTAYPAEGIRRRKGLPAAPGLPSNQPTAEQSQQSGATADA